MGKKYLPDTVPGVRHHDSARQHLTGWRSAEEVFMVRDESCSELEPHVNGSHTHCEFFD